MNTANDFNGDGFFDFMIAAPFAGGSAGRVNLFYGADTGTPVTTTNGNGLTYLNKRDHGRRERVAADPA